MHKLFVVQTLAGAALLVSAAFAHAAPIALTVTAQGSPNCGPDRSHGITPSSVYDVAAEALKRKGYDVVGDYHKVPGGKEVAISVMYCQTLGGEYDAYAGSAGMFAIADGTSAGSKGNRVAYRYSAANAGAGGSGGGGEDVAGKFRNHLYRVIQNWIDNSF